MKRAFDVEEWALEQIDAEMTRQYQLCVDNERWARKSSEEEVKAYELKQSDGCCGSWVIEMMAPDGEIYLIGCNYGH